MKKLYWSVATAALMAPSAWAQSTDERPVDLGEIAVVETSDNDVPLAYESFDPIDSGSSTITSQAIEADREGDIDTTELLKRIPGVQMDINRRDVSQRDVQDIRPSDFTISGGNFYNNNIIIDGVQANSLLDVTNSNAASFNDVAGQTSQTLYVDPTLLESITVRDSNVSARYGNFTGGVVEFDLRDPKDKISASASFDFHSDDLVTYKVASEDEADAGDELPSAPMFSKYRMSLSTDLPVSDKFKLLLSYSRSESVVDYEFDDAYGGDTFQNGDLSENYLVKGVFDFSDTLRATGQVTFSPYESEFQNANAIENLTVSNSEGLAAQFGLEGNHGELLWNARASYSKSDASRRTELQNYLSWPSTSDNGSFCTNRNCGQGGFGDIDQGQKDLALNIDLTAPLYGGDLSWGGEFASANVTKTRLQDNFAYSRGVVEESITCPTGDIACVDDDVVLGQYSFYKAYDADITVNTADLWAEYERALTDTITVRAGARVTNENFLNNTNIAPRLTGTWEFRPETFLTLGANRYYGKNMVSYAVREAYPDNYIFRRDLDDGAVSDWSLYSRTRSSTYGQSNLDTPYSDELTAALTIPTPLDGTIRFKVVDRNGRNQFARTASELIPTDNPEVLNSSYIFYTVNNEGKTDYQGLSAEWTGRYKTHALSTNITWSDTKTRGDADGDYFSEIDPDSLLEDLLVFNGEIISQNQLSDICIRSNFATPINANVVVNSQWFAGRLNTSVGAYFRDKYETIADSRDNITIDGQRYDVYEQTTRPSHVNVNLNAVLDVFETDYGSANVSVRVNNLFNDLPFTPTSSSNPYQSGRTIWIGAGYTF